MESILSRIVLQTIQNMEPNFFPQQAFSPGNLFFLPSQKHSFMIVSPPSFSWLLWLLGSPYIHLPAFAPLWLTFPVFSQFSSIQRQSLWNCPCLDSGITHTWLCSSIPSPSFSLTCWLHSDFWPLIRAGAAHIRQAHATCFSIHSHDGFICFVRCKDPFYMMTYLYISSLEAASSQRMAHPFFQLSRLPTSTVPS